MNAAAATALDTQPAIVRPGHPAAAVGGSMPLQSALALGGGIVLAAVAVLSVIAAAHTQGAMRMFALATGTTGALAAVALAILLVRNVARPVRAARTAARRMASGDLTGRIEDAGAGEIGELLQALRELQDGMFRVVSEVRTGTTSVAAAASTARRDNEALSQRTESQVSSLQQTAASVEEFAAAVRHNADNAQQANALVLASSQRASQGGALMEQVVTTMEAIRGSSRSIADILSVIDGIAFQTNILALNAAVEAARAGEEGRGFAVVAAEVRNLAQRSATAAREIKALVGSSVQQVDAGGKLVDDAGVAMQEIVASVKQVADLMREINAASQEQGDGIAAVNQAVGHIDSVAQNNAGLVEDGTRTVTSLHDRAVGLMRSVAGFQLGAREYGNAEEAQAMALRARDFCRAHGAAALIEDVNRLGEGRFIDRDLYLMVVGVEDALLHAHGNNLRNVGMNAGSRDADGKPFLADMAQLARTQGEGWIEWKWAHPFTNEILTKRGYVARAGDVLVVCGIYKDFKG